MQRLCGATALAVALGMMAIAPAGAQVPPPGTEAADIASCLCLHQAIDALSAELAAKQAAYQGLQADLTRLGERLQHERATMDVNDPEAVARFRQLLAQRDAAFRHSTSEVGPDLANTTGRYNANTGEYNARCANRPRNSEVLARVQASLVCPPAR